MCWLSWSQCKSSSFVNSPSVCCFRSCGPVEGHLHCVHERQVWCCVPTEDGQVWPDLWLWSVKKPHGHWTLPINRSTNQTTCSAWHNLHLLEWSIRYTALAQKSDDSSVFQNMEPLQKQHCVFWAVAVKKYRVKDISTTFQCNSMFYYITFSAQLTSECNMNVKLL